MSGFDELLGLAAETLRLWRGHLWTLSAWFCLGVAVHTAGLVASAKLGATHPVLATVVFVLGVVATLVALVLMIHTVQPSLRAPAGLDPDPAALARRRIPGGVVLREGRLEVVTAAVGPFLAVYAVWGFVDDQVTELFGTNYRLLGLDPQSFSISFAPDRLRFYLVLSVAVWVLRQALRLVPARRPLLGVRLVGVLAEAVWVFGVFALLVILGKVVRSWLRGRVAYAALDEGWQRLLAALPSWPLPFGLTLPRALAGLVAQVTGTVLPGAWHAVVPPLVWLALTATVLGWRNLGSGDLLAGIPLAGRIKGRRLPGGRRTRTVAALLTGDLRTKYLPVLEALQLVARSGPAFMSAYLLLATLITSLQTWFDIASSVVLGPRSAAASLATDPVLTLLSGLLVTPLSIALYAAGFDRALAAVGGIELRVRTPPRERRRPTRAATSPATRTPPG
ncbi:hypothetical protein [uncultured Friedmanniella sp.]|uniref:hypothetical protein n=1 Tax=uncultured Friedmanniella sp. TaxID=335381 RepID=UPI0035C9C043